MKCLVLLLLLPTAFASTLAMEFSNQYDTTNAIRDTILRIFQTVEPENIAEVINSVINSDLVSIETTPYEYGPLIWQDYKERIAKFYDLRITNAWSDNLYASFGFFNQKITFSTTRFSVQLSAKMKLNDIMPVEEDLLSVMNFSECTINAIGLTNNSENSFLIDLQYKHLDITSSGEATTWKKSHQNLQNILPRILQTYMNRNEKLLHTLGKIYNDLSIKRIIAKFDNSLDLKHICHYFIPYASIGSFYLRNLVVRGLWNFHTLDFMKNQCATTYILLIKNIRGSMTLGDVSRATLSTELMDFFIDSLSISVTQKNETLSGKAENYHIVKTNTNTPLNNVQSYTIMKRVERSIAESLMPLMKYHSSRWSLFRPEQEEEIIRQILTKTQLQSHDGNATTKSKYSDLTTATATAISLTNLVDEYDITNALNDTIIKILNLERKKVFKFIGNMNRKYNLKTEYKYSILLDGLRYNVTLCELEIQYETDSDKPRIIYGFQNNKMQLFLPRIVIRINGCFYGSTTFTSIMKFKGYTISVVESMNPLEPFPAIDYQYNNMEIEVTKCEYVGYRRLVKEASPLLLHDILNNDKIRWSTLIGYFDHQPMKDIIFKYPYFIGHEQEYHYSIPESIFGSFRFTNIIINGLCNFKNVCLTKQPEVLTLVIGNIRGSTNLRDGATNSTMELNFFVDSLSISVLWDTMRVNVETLNYSVFQTKTNARLSDLHSIPIMEHIESIIAASIFPTITYQRTTRVSPFSSRSKMENSIRRLLIEKTSELDQKVAEQSQYKCISLDDENLPTKISHGATIHPHYYISFPNLTIINLISWNQPISEHLQCPLINNSKFSHRITVTPDGKILRTNDTVNSLDINFHFDVPSQIVSIIKRNNSKENNSCEFQISNNQNIKVRSSSLVESSKEQLEMKKKIDTTLMSMTKERIVRNVKSMVCAPFNVCKQSAKIIDEFFSSFVDKVLKKCSLRRNNT